MIYLGTYTKHKLSGKVISHYFYNDELYMQYHNSNTLYQLIGDDEWLICGKTEFPLLFDNDNNVQLDSDDISELEKRILLIIINKLQI